MFVNITWWFSRRHSLDKLLIDGRWSAVRTARIYLNEGLAVLAELRILPSNKHISPFLRLFETKVQVASFATLEPPPRQPVGRTGGRGKRLKRPNNFLKSMKKGKPPEGGWSTFGCEGLACPTGGNPLSCFLPLGSGPRYRKAFQGKNRGVSFYYFLKLSEPHLIILTNTLRSGTKQVSWLFVYPPPEIKRH